MTPTGSRFFPLSKTLPWFVLKTHPVSSMMQPSQLSGHLQSPEERTKWI